MKKQVFSQTESCTLVGCFQLDFLFLHFMNDSRSWSDESILAKKSESDTQSENVLLDKLVAARPDHALFHPVYAQFTHCITSRKKLSVECGRNLCSNATFFTLFD